jgi:DivIVA domain-containing protein
VTPDDVRRVKFPTVRRGGYETREVDVFLAEAIEALDADDGRMRPEDVRDARFTLVKRGGYDTQDVDVFLDDLMAEFQTRAEATQHEPSASADVAPAAPAVASETAAPNPGPDPADAPANGTRSSPGITSTQLRGLKPPMVEADGYDITEVDGLLDAVADSLEVFEGVSGEDLLKLKGAQYLQGADGGPLLLSSDQILAARFSVEPEGGYDTRGVDAAIRRLGRALDYHWQREA